MDEQIKLNLADLPTMHPRLDLEIHSRCAVMRLGNNHIDRSCVIVNHRPASDEAAAGVRTDIGIDSVCTEEQLEKLANTRDIETITEEAAIAIAALSVYHFERAEIVTVLQRGSRADYKVEYLISGKSIVMEISGILADESPTGSKTRIRVRDKTVQLLEALVRLRKEGFRVSHGLVSVTSFGYLPATAPYTVLGEVPPEMPYAARHGVQP